jgi:stress response protein YsnF
VTQGAAAEGASQVFVEFESGERLLVPRELLQKDAAGEYRLRVSVDELRQAQADGKSLVIPVVEEQLAVERVVTSNRVQVAKTVRERVEVVDESLLSEEVQIERVAINQPLDAVQQAEATQVRRDGDVLIIPLVEEVLVVEKRLMLKEEVRIRKVQRETHQPQEVTLRSEQVDVTRIPGDGKPDAAQPGRAPHRPG